MMKRLLALVFLAFPITGFSTNQEPAQFIAEMVAEHQFDAAQLSELLSQAEIRKDILKAISRPAEAKPWYQYKPIFVNAKRIQAGLTFWQQHAELLAKAQAEFGVPAEIITAIIGVETFYGQRQGRFRVLDALNTLAFHYPKRAPFFRKELKQFLVLSKEQSWNATTPKGSYAGAMGMGQFIPSSYRHYAIDFDNDGKRNLFDNPADAIGSVANYFAKHHWQPGKTVAIPATADTEQAQAAKTPGLELKHTLGSLAHLGIEHNAKLDRQTPAKLLSFEVAKGQFDHWIGLDNFYVITRYNRSPLYAMAVYQLSQALAQRR